MVGYLAILSDEKKVHLVHLKLQVHCVCVCVLRSNNYK